MVIPQEVTHIQVFITVLFMHVWVLNGMLTLMGNFVQLSVSMVTHRGVNYKKQHKVNFSVIIFIPVDVTAYLDSS